MGIDEVNIKATVDYDPEKQEFFVSEISAVITDENGKPILPKQPARKPSLRPRRSMGSKAGKG